MKKDYPSSQELKSEFGRQKTIPEKYGEVILKALFHFPELKETAIDFVLVKEGRYPCATMPARVSLLGSRRQYTITVLEEAAGSLEKALLNNLPYEAQIAAIAHELAHVVQYEQCSTLKALRLLMRKKGREREFERQADILVIEHGLGFELYTYTAYIFRQKDYVEEHHDFDVNRLNPNEILEALPPDQLQEVHRF